MQLTPKVFDACVHLGRKKINISLLHMLTAGRIIPQPQQVALFSNLT